MPFEIRAHARYNPAASSRLNIVPGLVGTILTMTMLIFTALSVTREIERGTMESLLSMPIKPVEVMFGKIIPYVLVGFIQAILIIGIGVLLFGVPILGSLLLLALLSTLFITTNLSIGYTFSTIVQNQLQAMQMSMMFFLPSILLSGFMFPFAGMPEWAQYVGEVPAADALPAHRPRHHAEGRDPAEPAIRRDRAARPDAGRHDHRRDALPPHAGLRHDSRYAAELEEDETDNGAGRWERSGSRAVVVGRVRARADARSAGTELLRIKALIATRLLFMVASCSRHLRVDPTVSSGSGADRGHGPRILLVLTRFLLFEVVGAIGISGEALELDRDLPVVRRYIGALIETSLPTHRRWSLQIDSMGPRARRSVSWCRWSISSSSFFRRCGSISGCRPSPDLSPQPNCSHGRAVSSRRRSTRASSRSYSITSVRSFIILICGVLAGAVGVQLRRQFAASIAAATARDRVTNLFGQHVSPQVVERLLAEGTALRSDIRHVAVMFVDFRGFTAGAAARTPQEVVDRLDGAFAVLVEILDRHGGIVNKFLGDGFLALFGAPLEARDAAHARSRRRARCWTAMRAHQRRQTSWPLRIGIGIHFGEVVAGNIGSPRRKEYTVIGDTVNFASRLEALNKEFGSQLLISASVREALGDDGEDAVALGEVTVRGYEQPVAVFQLG